MLTKRSIEGQFCVKEFQINCEKITVLETCLFCFVLFISLHRNRKIHIYTRLLKNPYVTGGSEQDCEGEEKQNARAIR